MNCCCHSTLSPLLSNESPHAASLWECVSHILRETEPGGGVFGFCEWSFAACRWQLCACECGWVCDCARVLSTEAGGSFWLTQQQQQQQCFCLLEVRCLGWVGLLHKLNNCTATLLKLKHPDWLSGSYGSLSFSLCLSLYLSLHHLVILHSYWGSGDFATFVGQGPPLTDVYDRQLQLQMTLFLCHVIRCVD